MFKPWIKDVTDVSGVPANQREVGTDALRKYAESMVKGSTWGRQFINKYKKSKSICLQMDKPAVQAPGASDKVRKVG